MNSLKQPVRIETYIFYRKSGLNINNLHIQTNRQKRRDGGKKGSLFLSKSSWCLRAPTQSSCFHDILKLSSAVLRCENLSQNYWLDVRRPCGYAQIKQGFEDLQREEICCAGNQTRHGRWSRLDAVISFFFLSWCHSKWIVLNAVIALSHSFFHGKKRGGIKTNIFAFHGPIGTSTVSL